MFTMTAIWKLKRTIWVGLFRSFQTIFMNFMSWVLSKGENGICGAGARNMT